MAAFFDMDPILASDADFGPLDALVAFLILALAFSLWFVVVFGLPSFVLARLPPFLLPRGADDEAAAAHERGGVPPEAVVEEAEKERAPEPDWIPHGPNPVPWCWERDPSAPPPPYVPRPCRPLYATEEQLAETRRRVAAWVPSAERRARRRQEEDARVERFLAEFRAERKKAEAAAAAAAEAARAPRGFASIQEQEEAWAEFRRVLGIVPAPLAASPAPPLWCGQSTVVPPFIPPPPPPPPAVPAVPAASPFSGLWSGQITTHPGFVPPPARGDAQRPATTFPPPAPVPVPVAAPAATAPQAGTTTPGPTSAQQSGLAAGTTTETRAPRPAAAPSLFSLPAAPSTPAPPHPSFAGPAPAAAAPAAPTITLSRGAEKNPLLAAGADPLAEIRRLTTSIFSALSRHGAESDRTSAREAWTRWLNDASRKADIRLMERRMTWICDWAATTFSADADAGLEFDAFEILDEAKIPWDRLRGLGLAGRNFEQAVEDLRAGVRAVQEHPAVNVLVGARDAMVRAEGLFAAQAALPSDEWVAAQMQGEKGKLGLK